MVVRVGTQIEFRGDENRLRVGVDRFAGIRYYVLVKAAAALAMAVVAAQAI